MLLFVCFLTSLIIFLMGRAVHFPYNSVLVWCSCTNNILECVAPVRLQGATICDHLFIRRPIPNKPPPPNGSNWVASVVEGVGEQIRPLFSIIQPLGPSPPSPLRSPSTPPQGLGLPPTIWAARRPPQESPSCSRAPQNHPGFQNTNQPNNQFKSGSSNHKAIKNMDLSYIG